MSDSRTDQVVAQEYDVTKALTIGTLYGVAALYHGNFYAALPSIEEDRGMDNGSLGDYLSIAVVGGLFSIPITPVLQHNFGSRACNLFSVAGLAAATLLLASNGADWVFAVGMILYGFSTILVYSTAMAQGAILERSTSQLWMGVFSAVSGGGGVLGGLLGGVLLDYAEVTVWKEVLFVNLALFALILVSFPQLYSRRVEQEIMAEKYIAWNRWLCTCSAWTSVLDPEQQKQDAEEHKPILSSTQYSNDQDSAPTDTIVRTTRAWISVTVLCLIAGISSFVENSIGDWASIYLIDHWDCGSLIGILGYVAEKVCMIVAGVLCDWFCAHLQSRQLVFHLSVALTSLGFFLSFLAYLLPVNNASLAVAILGFGVAGFGLGLQIPIWFSMAGQGIKGYNVAEITAWVSACANIFCYLEPTIVGNVADDAGSLAYAFGFEALLVLVIFAFTMVLTADNVSNKDTSSEIA